MAKSKIEEDINELNLLIANSKASLFSGNKIMVDREAIEDILERMKKDLPKELAYCRDIMSRSEAIESEARERADRLVQQAADKTNELLSENEINQQARRKADEMVRTAAIKGQEIYDEYVRAGEEYRANAQEYLNEMLCNLQNMIYGCIEVTSRNSEKLIDNLKKVGETVTDNLNELNNDNAQAEANVMAGQTGSLDVDIDL